MQWTESFAKFQNCDRFLFLCFSAFLLIPILHGVPFLSSRDPGSGSKSKLADQFEFAEASDHVNIPRGESAGLVDVGLHFPPQGQRLGVLARG